MVITDPGIHQAMSFLVEHLPASLHLLITSRDTPPLPLARLRVRRQLGEVSAEDLRFTPDEAAALLADVMGLELDAETLAELEERTEGWIASLQLAALSLQGHDDARERIAAFSGGDAYLYDYLADEVLNRQPPEVQQFLLKTSVLERFDDALSGALLGVGEVDSAPGPQLAEVARNNLFLTPLGVERRWYRYHPLFAEFLRRRLEQLRPEWVQELHVRASEWYEAEGFSDEAVRHVLAGGEIERAVQLVESHSRAVMWQRGDYPTLRRWLEALPDEVVLARPRLSLDSAWLGLVGHRERDVPILAHVERLLGEILRLVADGLSNQEIAERLIRSIGTIKVHTSNIYGKFGVRGRTEAVARARELALLE